MIAKVYLWDNNAVTVFDELGNQLQEFQGMLCQVKDLILANATDATQFVLASWQAATNQVITREQFKEQK